MQHGYGSPIIALEDRIFALTLNDKAHMRLDRETTGQGKGVPEFAPETKTDKMSCI